MQTPDRSDGLDKRNSDACALKAHLAVQTHRRNIPGIHGERDPTRQREPVENIASPGTQGQVADALHRVIHE